MCRRVVVGEREKNITLTPLPNRLLLGLPVLAAVALLGWRRRIRSRSQLLNDEIDESDNAPAERAQHARVGMELAPAPTYGYDPD